MKKKVLLSLICFSSLFVSVTNAADLKKIEVLDNWNIEVLTTPDLVLPNWDINSDLKVLKDYIVSFASKDQQDSKKVFLNLTYDLEKNKDYTIIWVDWAEANMNFSISDWIIWEFVNNAKKSSGLNIEKIVITDPKTIEIYYDKELKAEEFLFKVLSEVKVDKKIWNWKDILNLSLKNPLENLTSYIILVEYLNNSDSKKVELKEKFYDFETGDNLKNVFENLNVSNDNLVSVDTWNLEEIASNVKQTPQTWASAWIIILFAFMLTWSFIIYSKKY